MGRVKRVSAESLLQAKASAVKQFLSAKPAEPRRDVAMLASGRHEDNVVGVGIGTKIQKGKDTGKASIRFYVQRKIGLKALTESMLLPRDIGGVPTDVIETGRFRALPASAAVAGKAVPIEQRRMRAARPGCSVGFVFSGEMARFVMAGTFGALAESAGKRYILSNNHVLANENELPVGAPIFQPGLLDGGDPDADAIAKLTRFVRIVANKPNDVDAAIAEILPGKKVASATFLPKVGKLTSGTPLDAVEGMLVAKVGRTSSYTTGKVFDVAADVRVGYEMGDVAFRDQILVVGDAGSFSKAGDSGSLIVERKKKQPVALLFAGSDTHTICNPIAKVLAALDVAIVI